MIHIDIKKLGRIDGIGHRITGDRTGQSNKRGTGWEYLHVAIAWFKAHGVTVQRVMTDNGSAYKSRAFAKAGRFIQTSIREWAYATPFQSSAARTRAMHPWLHAYNTQRPHSALKGLPPISRINRDNVLGNDS